MKIIRNNTFINVSFLTFKEKSFEKSIKSIKKRTLSEGGERNFF